MRIRTSAVWIGIVCILAIAVAIYSSGVFGVSAENLERDARQSQRIDSTWEVSASVNDKLAAMLFYNEAMDEHIFSLYLNREGLSSGYFFRAGGSTGEIMDGVHMFVYGVKGSAILSMNADRISRVEWYGSLGLTGLDLDPEKPFAVVISADGNRMALYNEGGELVPISVIEGV